MIIVNFKEQETNASKSGLWQWDYGQVLRIQGLKLPSAVEIHFSLQESGGEAVTRIGVTKDDATDVVIPDSMLENESTQGGTYSIYVFIYLTDETSGETEYKIKLLVSTRPRPEGRTESDKTTMAEILKVVNEIADSKEVSDEKIAEAVSNYLTVNPMEEKDPTVHDWAKQPEKPTYTASEVGADTSGTAESKVSEHNVATDAHNDIRLLIEGLTTRLNALADSDDTTLDQMSEVVAYIKSNKSLIDAITTSKVNVSDIIDNLTTNASNKPLSAAQGVALKALIDAIAVPTKLSELENDSGYAKTTDIPDKLPNPQKLTFGGAVTAEYDGSAPLSVEIPSGGGGVDSWELVNSVTTSEEVATVEISTNSSGETFSLENLLVAIYVPYGASITGQVSFINQWNTFKVSGIALSTATYNENRRNLVELRTEYFSGITFIYTRKNLGEAVSHISGKTNKYPISSVKVITSNSAMLPVGTFVGVYRK